MAVLLLSGACALGVVVPVPRQRLLDMESSLMISRKTRLQRQGEGDYLARCAQEAAWREDRRRTSNGDQVRTVLALVALNKPAVDFCGYWQR
jgi:hypothetical protein